MMGPISSRISALRFAAFLAGCCLFATASRAADIYPGLPKTGDTAPADSNNKIAVAFNLEPGWIPSSVVLTSADGTITYGQLTGSSNFYVYGLPNGMNRAECLLPCGPSNLSNVTLTINAYKTAFPFPLTTSVAVTGITVQH